MTTKDLITLLRELDPSGDMLVTERRYSDYGPMTSTDWSVATLYREQGGEYFTKTDYRKTGNPPTKTIHYDGN